ncbi:MAG: hypothetical protein Q4G66_10780 [bacterium]|nr:hypothetical protein [bacterium]
MKKTMMTISACLLLLPAAQGLATVPQGFENRSAGVVTEAPADLQTSRPAEGAAMNEEERLQRLKQQIAQIDAFLSEGGRYMSLAAEVTQAYEAILHSITDARANCELRRKTPMRQGSRYSGLYVKADQECFEEVTAMDTNVRQIAVHIDEVVEIARDLEEALQIALTNKEDKLIQQQILKKNLVLKATLEQARDAYQRHERTYQGILSN